LTAHYLVALQGAYRALYIINWIYLYFECGYWRPNVVLARALKTVLSIPALRRVQKTSANSILSNTSTISALSSRTTVYLLSFLRFVQLGTSAITTYIFCYLV